jgi:hypothetical protein
MAGWKLKKQGEECRFSSSKERENKGNYAK